jgi:hypothetical protein
VVDGQHVLVGARRNTERKTAEEEDREAKSHGQALLLKMADGPCVRGAGPGEAIHLSQLNLLGRFSRDIPGP